MRRLFAALGLLLAAPAYAQQVPHPVNGPATSAVDSLPCWSSTTGGALKQCTVITAPITTSATIDGLVDTAPGGPGIGAFGGYAQNLFQLRGNGHTVGTAPYTPPLVALEGDAISETGGTTSNTTHVGVIGYSSMNTTPYTYSAGKLEYWMGGYFIGGATTTCGGALPATPCTMIWGITSHATLYPPAAAVLHLTGVEVDVDNKAGTQTANRVGIHIGDIGALQAEPGGWDAGITISKGPTSIGFRNGIDFTNLAGGFGVAADGWLINATASGTVGGLINWFNVTCTGPYAVALQSGWGVTCDGGMGLPGKTVASLPTCTGPLGGRAFYVTDAAAAPVYLAPTVGGGAAKVLAVCNGTAGQWQNH
jgi:hypothetical protein